jgi:hypothetical protein
MKKKLNERKEQKIKIKRQKNKIENIWRLIHIQ